MKQRFPDTCAYITLIFLGIGLAGCKLNSPMPPPAPVQERPIQSSPGLSPAKPVADNAAANPVVGVTQYLVQKGDTLYGISKKLGIPLTKLAALNQLAPPFALQAGQLLTTGKQPTTNTVNATTSQNLNAHHAPNNEDAEVVTAAISQPPAIAQEAGAAPTVTTTNTVSSPVVAPNNHAVPPTTVAQTSNAATAPAASTAAAKTTPETSAALEALADNAIDWQWPLRGKVLAAFDGQTNKGLNIAGTAGQAVSVASAGKVIYSGIDIRGYGKLVIVKHNSNLLSVYAHHGISLVKEGSFVAAQEKIATLPTSATPAPMLHFEIRQKGKPVDPMGFLPANTAAASN